MKHYPHETVVLALFRNPELIDKALKSLNTLELKREDVRVIRSKEAYEQEELVQLVAGNRVHGEALHSGKMMGIAGAVLLGLTAVTGAISGGASLLVAGPMVAVSTGAGALLGGWLGTGFTDEEAKKVDHALEEGETMILIHAKNRKIAGLAKDKMKAQGADMVHCHH